MYHMDAYARIFFERAKHAAERGLLPSLYQFLGALAPRRMDTGTHRRPVIIIGLIYGLFTSRKICFLAH